jgi:hypothetical protein
MERWDIPARIIEFLLLVTIIIQAILFWDQIKEMRLDRRAWVSVHNTKGFPKVGEYFRITCVFTNTGRTFAKHIRTVIGSGIYEVAPNFPEAMSNVAKILDPEIVSDTLLAPNALMEATSKPTRVEKISEADFNNLRSEISEGKRIFLIYGQITYEDIFSHPHWLTFCERLVYDPLQSDNDGWSWGTYAKWNDTGDGDPPVRY